MNNMPTIDLAEGRCGELARALIASQRALKLIAFGTYNAAGMREEAKHALLPLGEVTDAGKETT